MGWYRSPEFTGKGLEARFAVSVDRMPSYGEVVVHVEHRDGSDDPWSVADEVWRTTMPGSTAALVGGPRKIVRYAVSFPDGAAFRLEPPKWRGGA